MLMGLELDHIEAFVAIVRSGGFTRAAATLHLSQPAISRRVLLLEHELGASLFERGHGGAALTDAGTAFLAHAEAVLASVRDGIDAVVALRRTDRGTITLAMVGTLASTPLTDLLRRFREKHRGVDLRLRTALSREVSDLVRRREATLGLRYGADPHTDVVSAKIHDERMVAVCSATHPLALARSVHPKSLAGERWLAFPSHPDSAPEPYSSVVANALAACGLGASEIVPIDSLTAQKRMVEAGFGLALLPESSVDQELHARTLHALRVPALRATIPVVLIHRRGGYLSGAAMALKQMLAAWPGSDCARRAGR